MVTASYTQTSFLGGEISQWAQGQYDKPYYKVSLTRSFNLWPSDEGALPRRPGFRFLGTTKGGNPGRLIAFDFSQSTPYNIELTDNAIRMWNNSSLVTTNDDQTVQSVSNDTAAIFTLAQTVTWQTGDTVTFAFTSPQAAAVGNALLGRQYLLTMIDNSHFTVTDVLTGFVPGSADNIAGLTPVVSHVLQLQTSYSLAGNSWKSVRLIQGYNVAVLLQGKVLPQVLQVLNPPTASSFATFSFTPASFQDGPYLDPIPLAIATPTSVSANLQLTIGYSAWSSTTIYGVGVPVSFSGTEYVSLRNNNVNQTPGSSPTFWQALPAGVAINSGSGFVSTDVGRMIRLFYNPQIWSPTTTYGAGANVTYNGSYFTALTGSNTNNQPDISTAAWIINPVLAYWTWGFITNINSQKSITVQLQGAPLLDLTPILTWRLGAWSDTTGWPKCGVYQEGRFWYAGAIKNRFDASQPNQPFNMAPTGQDGTVADSSAISYTFNATEQNDIFWGIPDHQGILWGTQEGEFLTTSGTANVSMTPSNIQSHRETKYGSSDIQPVRTGLTICFVKRYARRIIEYLADVFSNRFLGNDLTQNARHLGARGIEELEYQEELIPTVWARCTDGSLIGTTYRRNSLLSNQPPEFNGFHQHAIGSGRLLESISVGPSVSGTLDALSIVSNDPSTNIRFVEQMTTLLDETASITQAWYLDTAVTPKAAKANITLETENPQWRGSVDAGVSQRTFTMQNGGMLPITLNKSTGAVDVLLAGGYIESGGSSIFEVVSYNVTGDTPVQLTRTPSASFTTSTVSDCSWSLSPDGRYIAMYLQSSATLTNQFVIYDTALNVFGTVLGLTIPILSAEKQIAWLDQTHLVIDDTTGSARGLHVLGVAGLVLSDLGFTSVWGASTASTRTPLGYSQFTSSAGGLLNYMSNVAIPYFTTIFARQLTWNGSGITVGSAYTVASGLTPDASGGGHYNFVKTSTNEWTFCFGTLAAFQLISFEPTSSVATIIRPWQSFAPTFVSTTQFPMLFGDRLVIIQGSSIANEYRLTDVVLNSSNFALGSSEIAVSGAPPHTFAFNGIPLDSSRFLLSGSGGFANDILQFAIVERFPLSPTHVPATISFYMPEPYNGKKVSVFAAGIDCGDLLVANGKVDIPYGTVDPVTGWIFNEQSFKTLQPLSSTFEEMSMQLVYGDKTYNIPCVIGHNYISEGQLCRPQTQQDTGAKNGPGFGKKRRSSKYAVQLSNAVGLKVGVDLDKCLLAPLTKIDAGGKTLNYLQTFTGIMREGLNDDHTYDSMLAWKIDRPYPATVIALGAFIETVDI